MALNNLDRQFNSNTMTMIIKDGVDPRRFMANDQEEMIEKFYKDHKPVAAVCPIILVEPRL